MFPIRTTTIESSDSADIALSRIDWKVEKVAQFVDLFTTSTVDTIKPWVGKIDRKNRMFEILQTAPFWTPKILSGNFFRLFVKGRIADEGEKSRITLRFVPGLASLAFLPLTYTYPILTTSMVLKDTFDWRALLIATLLGASIPAIATLALFWQMKRTENKLIELFEESR